MSEGRRVLVTGAAGFIGSALVRALAASAGDERIVAFDQQALQFNHPKVDACGGDIADPALARALVDDGVSCIVHLASLVSGGAEQDYERGLRVNFDATRELLEAARRAGHAPVFVFSSSIAVYGRVAAGQGLQVDDATAPAPAMSYGTHKLMCEALIDDMSRRGFVDGRCLRLPTVMVRPDVNTALSGWASALVREPLAGRDYDCPVRPDTQMACISVGKVVQALRHAATLPADRLGARRTLLIDGLPASASEMLAAVQSRAGQRRLGTVRFRPDAPLQAVMNGLPCATTSARARELGFPRNRDIGEIVDEHLQSLA